LIAHISSTGFDPHSDTYRNGARPIKRMIQKELLNELSRQIIAGTLEQGTPMVMDVFDGKIVLRKPIDEKESRLDGRDDHGKSKKSKAEV
jgi:ATP-dependent Clp protease ATP-binding subunit ClpB